MAQIIIAPSISLVNGIPMTTSADIATRFEKPHDAVLKSIRKVMAECPDEFNAVNFYAVEYIDAKGEQRPAFNMTRDAFSLVAMGFTGKKALAWKLKYIEAFNGMEKALHATGPKQKALPGPKQAAFPAPESSVPGANVRLSALVDELLAIGTNLIARQRRLIGTGWGKLADKHYADTSMLHALLDSSRASLEALVMFEKRL